MSLTLALYIIVGKHQAMQLVRSGACYATSATLFAFGDSCCCYCIYADMGGGGAGEQLPPVKQQSTVCDESEVATRHVFCQ